MKTESSPSTPKMFLAQIRRQKSNHTIRHFIEAMRRHDPTLIDHGKRTATYSLLVGQALGLPYEDLSDLCHAALLHDLGKLTLPNEVTHHNGLSIIGDYVMTECSPQAGADILRSWPELQGIAKIIALHHERWDGNGLPFGMRGHLIPLGARILSLTDTVDQLLFQKAFPIPHQAEMLVRILRNLSGTRFDPNIVSLFITQCVPQLGDSNHDHSPNTLGPLDQMDFPRSPSPSMTPLDGDHATAPSPHEVETDSLLQEIVELTRSPLDVPTLV